MEMDNLSNYDYHLPPELIATTPLPRRDQSRLLVVHRRTGELEHRRITDLPELLRPGDCLVLNDTRVLPARLLGRRAATGGKWEGLFLEETLSGAWRLIGQTRGRLQAGETIVVSPAHAPDSEAQLTLLLVEQEPEGVWVARPEKGPAPFFAPALELLEQFGTMPLPPYIGRDLATADDWQRYQTTYSCRPGAVAAPTAGLHFTPELLDACSQRGVQQAYLTLHVGIGTFRPITVQKLDQHRMHAEWCELSPQVVELLNRTRRDGGRIVAVGTTSVRTLESAAQSGGLRPWSGPTDLFIRPPYQFRTVDCLLTNFHLPRSTLLVLVSAFAGTELILRAYREAIDRRYRFYSYGDAMLIV